jgi:prepilin-type N-terminal cleavage/methylation domain-containing protein
MTNLRKASAFTLIELLAVVTIIAVLAALLVPSAKSFVARGQDAKCLSNLHQMGAAIAAYAGEHNDELPINNSQDGGFRWYLMLNPYLGKSTSSDDGGWAPPSIFICPTNDRHSGDADGGKYKLWVDCGYACNLALMPRWSGKDSDGKDIYYPNPPTRLSSRPQRHVLVADISKDRNQFLKSTNNGLPYGTVENARVHRGGVNMLWTDYSVSWMKAEDVVSDAGKTFCWY